MALFKTNRSFYSNGVLFKKNTDSGYLTVNVSGSIRPRPNWIPLDKEAEQMMEKCFPGLLKEKAKERKKKKDRRQKGKIEVVESNKEEVERHMKKTARPIASHEVQKLKDPGKAIVSEEDMGDARAADQSPLK